MPETRMNSEQIQFVTGYSPGLVERVTELHANYYVQHWGFTAFFEARVASEMSDFFNCYDDTRDCTWSVVVDGQIEASITIDGIDATGQGAHLRWFIASDKMRGKGIGARLIDRAMDFCRQKGYRRVFLHTFEGLESARHLYERHAFKLVESRPGEQWGTRVEEQRYETGF